MPAAIESIDSFTVFSDPALYAAHPQIVAAGSDRFVVSFNAAPRRKGVLHPPHDPTFRTYLVTSDDGGCSWSKAFEPFPEAPSGVECAGLTRLPDGTIALNRFTFDWRQSDIEDDDFDPPEILRAELTNSVELAGIAEAADAITKSRGPGRATLSFSYDAGRTWSPEIDLNGGRFGAGCGLRGGLAGADGMQLHLSDPPRYAHIFRLFVDSSGVAVRPPELVAERPGRAFEEPAVILLDGGVALLVLRENEGRSLWSCRSSNGGATWSEPAPLGIGSSHPAALLALGPREVTWQQVAATHPPPYCSSVPVMRE